MKQTSDRFTEKALQKMRDEIELTGGNEVMFIGHTDKEGIISKIEVASRGDEVSAPALLAWLHRGDVVIHNHPSGQLKPSQADMGVASYIGNLGFGFYIVDNEVTQYYAVSEPADLGPVVKLDKQELLNCLEPDGPLSKIFEKYEYREAQVEMIGLIVDAFNENKVAVIEAGTGVGKSLAYLLPSIAWAAANKEKIVISTATINLQQQIVDKDILLAQEVLGVDIQAVLVKGRGNYLCLRRLDDALQDLSLFEEENDDLEAINDWAENAKEGCKTELPFMPDAGTWGKVNSEPDSCFGLKCQHREKCFILKMKKRAAAADILVVNHHLLFADLSYRLDGAGFESAAVLPPFRKVVFDEAHNIEASATSFFSETMNRFSLMRTLGRLVSRKRQRYTGLISELKKLDLDSDRMAALPAAVDDIREALDMLDTYCVALTERDQSMRLKQGHLTSDQTQMIDYIAQLHGKVGVVHNLLGQLSKEIPEEDQDSYPAVESAVILTRLEGIAQLCNTFIGMDEHPHTIFWVKRERTTKGDFFVSFTATPLKIAPKLQEALFEPFDSIVCTSATLTVSNRFDNFFKKTGIHRIDQERLVFKSYPSPFPYKTNVLLQVPTDGPEPNHPRFTEYVQRYTRRALEITEGKGLVLFTSYKMLNDVYEFCEPHLKKMGITVFKQGDDERSRLLNNFKNDIASVLFATASFWEGVDSPGETLSIVIIAKLPFSVPTDPILNARMEAVEAAGGNPFMEISVPDAVMKLKQGFGRLIRSHDDRGVVTILDGRLVRKAYGGIFFDSLPESAKSVTVGRSLMQDLENFLY